MDAADPGSALDAPRLPTAGPAPLDAAGPAADILNRLRFIAHVAPGERLYVAGLAIQAEWFGAGVARWYANEGRNQTFDFVGDAVETGLQVAGELAAAGGHYNCELARLVLAALDEAQTGLAALARTYRADRMFVARVTTLRDTLALRVAHARRRQK